MRVFGIIYLVTCLINGKKYVGQTKNSIRTRWVKGHLSDARQGKQHLLAKAIRKYGSSNFRIEEIDVAPDQETLDVKEKGWIASLGTMAPSGYNLREGGAAGGRASNETREKIRLSKIGVLRPDEVKQKISDTLKAKVDRNYRLASIPKRKTQGGKKPGPKPKVPEQEVGGRSVESRERSREAATRMWVSRPSPKRVLSIPKETVQDLWGRLGRKGLLNSEISDQLGISPASLGNYKAGRVAPPDFVLSKLQVLVES